MKDVIKLKEEELIKIPLVDGRSEEDDAAASKDSQRRNTRSASWLFLQSLHALMPGDDLKALVRRAIAKKTASTQTNTTAAAAAPPPLPPPGPAKSGHLHHPHVTLIDAQATSLPVLRHTLAATRAAAPGMLDSAIVVAYDAQTCRAVDDEKEGSALFGLPCYHNATWLAAVQKVTRSLPAHRGSLHDVMVGRLGTTLAALCQHFMLHERSAFMQVRRGLITAGLQR